MADMNGKSDGFRDEKYMIVPTESFTEYMAHPLIRAAYLTDVGFFPKAKEHYREREEGADQYILIYCTEGKGIIEVEDQIYRLEKSDAFCIPRNVRHKYYADEKEPGVFCGFILKGKLLFRVLERNYTIGNFIYISQVLSLILSEVYFRERVDESSTQDRHVTMVIRYMYQHLRENLTLEEISEEVQLSKSYLNAVFKAQTGKSPVEFFIHLKMQEACKLLKSTDYYIYEVSSELGYTDQYYFSRIFKKVVGVSPKDYKNGDYFYSG